MHRSLRVVLRFAKCLNLLRYEAEPAYMHVHVQATPKPGQHSPAAGAVAEYRQQALTSAVPIACGFWQLLLAASLLKHWQLLSWPTFQHSLGCKQ